jgi:maleamate amidohydrolase
MQIDTLLIGGCVTSGCVRASAVDAAQYGFRPLVVREAVGDRSPLANEANLMDIAARYGDVISLEEAKEILSPRSPRTPR